MESLEGNQFELLKLLITFILLDKNDFPAYQKLWDTACEITGEKLYTLLRIQPQVASPPERIQVEDKEAFFRLMAGIYAGGCFGKSSVLSVANRLYSVFDTGYTDSYFCRRLRDEINLRKNNNKIVT